MVFNQGFLKAKIEGYALGVPGEADWLVPGQASVVFLCLMYLGPDVILFRAFSMVVGWMIYLAQGCMSVTLSLKQMRKVNIL